jgi:hypothetical protein
MLELCFLHIESLARRAKASGDIATAGALVDHHLSLEVVLLGLTNVSPGFVALLFGQLYPSRFPETTPLPRAEYKYPELLGHG